MADKHWSHVQESGMVFGMKFMFFIYRVFGRAVFALLLYPVIAYYYTIKSPARQASKDFLRRAIDAGADLPAAPSLSVLSYRHFLAFGQNLLDKLAAWTGAFNYDNVRFHCRNDFLSMVDQDGGALVIVSHLGNLEVCRALANASQRVRLNILVHTKHAEKFNSLLRQVDQGNHLNLMQVTDISPATAVLLKAKLDAGEVVVIAGDRTPVNGGRTSDVNFLGATAPLPQGPYVLASVLKCPVYLMFSAKEKTGYQIYFETFAEHIKLPRKTRDVAIQQYAQAFADRLAYYTLKYPLQWNNFYAFWNSEHTLVDVPSAKPNKA